MNSKPASKPEPVWPGFGFLSPASTTKIQRREELLDRYEYHAAKAEGLLVEAYALDEAAMDRHFPHLRKVNVPRRKPD